MIPCKNCLVLPICRHKYSNELICCDLLLGYLLRTAEDEGSHHIFSFKEVEKTLKPTKWYINKNGDIIKGI